MVDAPVAMAHLGEHELQAEKPNQSICQSGVAMAHLGEHELQEGEIFSHQQLYTYINL
jgi:hypothetical protein